MGADGKGTVMQLFTIGFNKTSADEFFTKLKQAGVTRLIDVRLNNRSQLAGFTKRNDLQYFAREICGIPYCHELDLAPTQDMFDGYKKVGGSWQAYARKFGALIAQRRIETIGRDLFDGACLLCSEKQPHHCHRRLVGEYLQRHWRALNVTHL